jgi:hypothetical protein
MWGLVFLLLILVVSGIVVILVYLKVITNPFTKIKNSITGNTDSVPEPEDDPSKLTNDELIKQIKKNAATNEIAQSYLDGGEVKLELLNTAILIKLYYVRGNALSYIFGIIPVITHIDYDAVITSYDKKTNTFGGTPITDTNAVGYTEYKLLRTKVDKLKNLWKTTTSSPFPSTDQVFFTYIDTLN